MKEVKERILRNQFGKRAMAFLMALNMLLSVSGGTAGAVQDRYEEQTELARSVTASDGNTYQVTVQYDAASGVPADAELSVSEIPAGDGVYEEYVEKTADALGEAGEKVLFARAFEIALVDPETGETVQPEQEMQVSIELMQEDLEQAEVSVVEIRAADDGPEEAEVLESTVSGEAVAFSAGGGTASALGSSVHVVVGTVLEQRLTASDGSEYLVTVTCGPASGIPEDAELSVREIREGDEGYEDYAAQSAEAIGATAERVVMARAFDISLLNPETGEEYQPEEDVTVSIQLLNDDLSRYAAVDVVHFAGEADGEAEVIESSVSGEAVEFTADGFSVYVIISHEGDADVVTPRVEFIFVSPDYTDNGTGYTALPYSFENQHGGSQSAVILKNGETLDPIVSPPNSGTASFYGWYVVDGTLGASGVDYTWPDTPVSVDFENPIAITADNSAHTLDWTLGAAGGTGVPMDADGMAVVFLAPLYDNCFFTAFHQGAAGSADENILLSRKLAVAGGNGTAQVRIDDVRAAAPDGRTFAGWQRADGTRYNVLDAYGEAIENPADSGGYFLTVNAADVAAGADFDLYPAFYEVRWIRFMDGTAETLPSVSLVTNDDGNGAFLTELPVPAKSGYVFIGWSDRPGGGSLLTDGDGVFREEVCPLRISNAGSETLYELTADGKLCLYEALSGPLPVYANWMESTDTTYSVNVWRQRVTDDKDAAVKTYDYVPGDSATGIAGSVGVTLAQLSLDAYEGHTYDGFHHAGTTMSTDSAGLAADGSTVVNVYYDRDLMTVNFRQNGVESFTLGGSGSGYTYTPTDAATGELYGLVDGEYVLLEVEEHPAGTVYYTYNSSGTDILYSGVFYGYSIYVAGYFYDSGYSGSNLPTDPNRQYYGLVPGLEGYTNLTRRTTDTTTYTYSYTDAGGTEQPYDSSLSRYTRSSSGGPMTWTGLYGQTLAQNGYSWDTVSPWTWQDALGNTVLFLNGFTRTENPLDLDCQGDNNGGSVYLYRMQSDGSYTAADKETVRTSDAGAFFSNVIEGYTAASYSTEEEGFLPEGGSHPIPDDTDGMTAPLHVYYERNPYRLTYDENYDGGAVEQRGVTYLTPLADYAAGGSSAYTATREHYRFDGWFADKALSVPFDFNRTMPAEDVTVYAKWSPDQYLIRLDPNGGTLPSGTYTYFYVPGGTVLTRPASVLEYVPVGSDPYSGTIYKYVHMKYVDGEDLPETLRFADYVRNDRLDSVYDEYVAALGNDAMYPWDWIPTYVGGGDYRPVLPGETYTLEGWYVVNEDGTESSTPYNFSVPVSGPLTLRAHWRQNTGFRIAYNAEAVVNGVTLNRGVSSAPAEVFADGAVTQIGAQPDGITVYDTETDTDVPTTDYVFKGWSAGGTVYQPGQDFTVRAALADGNGVITMQAVYERRGESQLLPEVVTLTLNANGGTVDTETPPAFWSYGDVSVDGDTNTIQFQYAQANAALHLDDYQNLFTRDGWFLLGFDENANAAVPAYAADAVLSVGRTDATLYAVWERKAYLTIQNLLPSDASLTVAFQDTEGEAVAGPVYLAAGTYDREEADLSGPVTVGANASVRFVVPDGVNYGYAVSGTNNIADVSIIRVQTSGGQSVMARSGQSYAVDGTLTLDDTTHEASATVTLAQKPICKIGSETFVSFAQAMGYVAEQDSHTATIEMLVDYTMPETDVLTVPAGYNITLTTAPTSGVFNFLTHYEPDTPGRETALITRGFDGGSMVVNNGTLTLANVTLDGGGETHTTASDGALVRSADTLNLSGAELRNAVTTTGRGGAVYASGTVNMSAGTITGNSAANGSAVYLDGAAMYMSGGTIEHNTGAADGAVVPGTLASSVNFSGSPVVYSNTNAAEEDANVYLGFDSVNIIKAVGTGLAADAVIGVKAVNGHNGMTEQFAYAENNARGNLDRFINDDYGFKGELRDGTANQVIWRGLTLRVTKAFAGAGINTGDTFTLTISSPAITRSDYSVMGTTDVEILPASDGGPGRIELTEVTAGTTIDIYPLPIGTYTVSEGDCVYQPAYTAVQTDFPDVAVPVDNGGSFTMGADTSLTVTNSRKTAEVNLRKTLIDANAASGAGFDFTVTLTEADGTPIEGFAIDEAETIATGADGVTTTPVTLSPAYGTPDDTTLTVPVGAVMTITEAENPAYSVSASGVTRPAEGEGTEIADADAGDRVFRFTVTEDGAQVTYVNTRRTGDIVVSKQLTGAPSSSGEFSFTAELTYGGTPVGNYRVYDGGSDGSITTGSDGRADFTLTPANGGTDQITLRVPAGVRLSVTEGDTKETIGGQTLEVYDTTVSVNGAAASAASEGVIDSVSTDGGTIAFANARKTQEITVKKTVNGYAGNQEDFNFTATLQDASGTVIDYNLHGFSAGVQTFQLRNSGTKKLTTPRGTKIVLEEAANNNYTTTVKRGSTTTNGRTTEYVISADETFTFTNVQFIALQLINETHAAMTTSVKITKAGSLSILSDGTAVSVPLTGGTGSVTVPANSTVHLIVPYVNDPEYTVSGTGHENYYMTVVNEPAYHQDANPPILYVYNGNSFSVAGKLRFGPADSYVRFTEKPLVSFDVNGGAWTTEMEEAGYHDRDGGKKVYQIDVPLNGTVSAPTQPVYRSGSHVVFGGWTKDSAFAADVHSDQQDLTGKLFDFTTPITEPLTLYAVWLKESAAVTYNYGNGTWTETDPAYTAGTGVYTRYISKGTAVPKPADPDPAAGYAFLGWTADDTYAGERTFDAGTLAAARAALYDFNEPVTGDQLTLYAVYGAVAAVTFDLTYQGSTHHGWNDTDSTYYTAQGAGARYTATVLKGDVVRRPANPSFGGTAEWSFLKWVTDDGSCAASVPYSAMNTVTGYDFDAPVTGNLTLYTSWVDADSVEITISKEVIGLVSPDQEFTYQYWTDENTYGDELQTASDGTMSTFTLKANESRTITIFAKNAYEGSTKTTQTLHVTEAPGGYELSSIGQKLTGTSGALTAGTADAGAGSYVIEAVHADLAGTYERWDADRKGITVTYTNVRSKHDVTVQNYVNGGTDTFAYTVRMTDSGRIVSGYELAGGLTTDETGSVQFDLTGTGSRTLSVPYGVKIVVTMDTEGFGTYGWSNEYTDGDTQSASFTVNSVLSGGTILFASGVMKTTASDGSTLWTESGGTRYPAVYMTLTNAFTDYTGTFYADRSGDTEKEPAAVKLLVDDYTIQRNNKTDNAVPFPNAALTLTTADSGDAVFPYIGTRTRSTIYRYAAGNSKSCFTMTAGTVTLTNIVLDGGTTLGRSANGGTNGSLINVSGGTLNITTGATLRNSKDNGTSGNGGAVYLSGAAVLNMSAGVITNCQSGWGGAVYGKDTAVLNITGSDGSTRFEDCTAANHGGAVYYNGRSDVTINGGGTNLLDEAVTYERDDERVQAVLDAPGVLFTRCVAQSNGTLKCGGAVYDENVKLTVTGTCFTECATRDAGSTTLQYGGGAICAGNSNHGVTGLEVAGCTFTACDTSSHGGGINAVLEKTKDLVLRYCVFDRCNSAGQGGGVSSYQKGNPSDGTGVFKLYGTEFNACTSGTLNGSGGAIQSYFNCMSLTKSEFTDCWTGKEGGAINHFAGGGNVPDTRDGSYTDIVDCTFTRCRGEDRYQPNDAIHYGGGICTKGQKVTVIRTTFDECYSTITRGGALYVQARGVNSVLDIQGSTFINCSAKDDGGAVAASSYKLTVDADTTFENCSTASSATIAAKGNHGGGALYHGAIYLIGDTQNETTLYCTFKNCSSAQAGGAVWTRAKTVNVDNCTIENCTAGTNGGALYLSNGLGNAKTTITSGSITGCTAANGSAVFTENYATFVNAQITGNKATSASGGAVAGANNNNVRLYFSGSTKVTDNVYTEDNTPRNVVLARDLSGVSVQKNNSNYYIINTTAEGLAADALIGVYVADTNNAYAKHGQHGQTFATLPSVDNNLNLNRFVNDRHAGLYGGQSDLNNRLVYWGEYVCKITDADGNTLQRPNGEDAVYISIEAAFSEYDLVEGGTPAYVKMLVEECTLTKKETIGNISNGPVTLTTAPENDAEYPYRGTSGTFCTIHRSTSYADNNPMFTVTQSDTVFTLENITLDGRKDLSASAGTYRLIQANNGALVINGGTTMQYGSNQAGAAVYAANAASVTVNSTADAHVLFEHCKSAAMGSGDGGGAIFAKGPLSINAESEGTGEQTTIFRDCACRIGGAVYVDSPVVTIQNTAFYDCNSNFYGGAVYHNNNTTGAVMNLKNCKFENCHTNTTDTNAHGGAVVCKANELTVEDCAFKNCYADKNGGAVNHGGGNSNRARTTILNTTFDGCSSTNSQGGSVYTQAIKVVMENSTITGSTSKSHGGGLFCESSHGDSEVKISGSTMTGCLVTNSDGYGGAVYSRTKIVTIEDKEGVKSKITNCAAQGRSGAVYMVTGGSTLNLKDNTEISTCSAPQGGAIYVPGAVKVNVTDNVTFRNNGSVTIRGTRVNANEGACFFLAENSQLHLSGALTFAGNRLVTKLVTNEGVYGRAKEDIFLYGYSSGDAGSLYVDGDLTGSIIYVWPDQNRHMKANDQFGNIADGVTVTDDTLAKFRNGQKDGTDGTLMRGGQYLQGTRGAKTKMIYWGTKQGVAFMKLDSYDNTPLPGAAFTLYTDRNCTTEYRSATSDLNGQVQFDDVAAGVYYMRETHTPDDYVAPDYSAGAKPILVLVGSLAYEASNAVWQPGGELGDPSISLDHVRAISLDAGAAGIFEIGPDGKAVVPPDAASTIASVGYLNDRENTGSNVTFKKVDGSGADLKGAQFSLYPLDDPAGTAGNEVELTLSDGATTATVVESDTNGNVNFHAPSGFFYMKETNPPAGYAANTNTYIVLSGIDAVTVPNPRGAEWAGVLSGIEQTDINAQRGTRNPDGSYERDSAVFLIDGGKAVTTPNIAADGIVNERVKIGVSFTKFSDSGTAIEGVKFALYPNTEFKSEQKVQEVESGADGTVSFQVPAGIYYMKETYTPAGYVANENGYVVLVGSDSVTVPGTRTGVWANGGVLSDITQANINSQRGTESGGVYERDTAVFQIDGGKAVTTPNIAADGIVNERVKIGVSFTKKSDNGSALGGAKFALYEDSDCTGSAVTLTLSSGTGTSVESAPDGTVSFRVPAGIYYMKETTTLTGYEENTNRYVVLVGSDSVTEPNPRTGEWTGTGVLADITQENINTQRGGIVGGVYERDTAVFQINGGKAVTTPNIAADGIVNERVKIPVSFTKTSSVDRSGLAGAKFSLYEDSACTGSAVTLTLSSGTGTSVESATDGSVSFSVPAGIYYMKETNTPTGYNENQNKYVVLVGSDNLTVPSPKSGIWTDIDQDDVDVQRGKKPDGSYTRDAAVFLIDGGKAAATPNIASDGILNIRDLSTAPKRKVILKKSDSAYTTLAGAEFELYYYDGSTKVTTGAGQPQISSSSGVFYIGELAYGTYYLKETTAPGGFTAGKWFCLIVGPGADGIRLSAAADSKEAARALLTP